MFLEVLHDEKGNVVSVTVRKYAKRSDNYEYDFVCVYLKTDGHMAYDIKGIDLTVNPIGVKQISGVVA